MSDDGRVRCIECAHVTSEGVPAGHCRGGMSLCKVQPQPTGTYFTLEYPRQCHLFSADSSPAVEARRAWLAEVAARSKASLNLPSSPGQD